MFLICLISSLSLDFVHIISVRCTKVDIRFVFCLVELKKSQRKYHPVKVCFLYTLVSKPVTVCCTLMSRNGEQLFFSFSKVNLREGWRQFFWFKKFSDSSSLQKIANVSSTYLKSVEGLDIWEKGFSSQNWTRGQD